MKSEQGAERQGKLKKEKKKCSSFDYLKFGYYGTRTIG